MASNSSAWKSAVVLFRLVLVGSEHLGAGHLVGETEVATIADAGSTHLTLLGSHKDDTVRSTCTIDSGRSILQHGDALDLRGIEVVEGLGTQVLIGVADLDIIRIDVSVDDEQRLLSCRANLTQRVDITDTDAGRLTGTSVTASNRHTVNQSAQ